MARNKIPTDGRTANTPVTSSPFAALGALRASLPDVPIVEPSSSSSSSASPALFSPKVVVRKEKKGHGGKTVTIVSGVLPSALDEVCKLLKSKLGCGARVEGDDVVIQGDLSDRVAVAVEALGARKIVRGS